MRSRQVPRLLLLGVGLAALAVIRLITGYEMGWPGEPLVRELRLASALGAIAVGTCLSVSGVMLQSLLRNPLASPYILGLASGAALGVGAAQLLGRGADPVPWLSQPAAAVAGSLIVLLLVYRLSRQRGAIEPMTMLLVGVMLSVIASALLMLLTFLMGPSAEQLLRWMMGRIAPETPLSLLSAALLIAAAGLGLGLKWAPALDAAALSDDEALSVGVRLDSLRLGMFIVAGTLTAVSVVLAGPIGFVGLIAPHAARVLLGPGHAALLIGAALIGGGLLLAADSLVQIIQHLPWIPQPRGLLPIGILTSAIGGPVFIYLLRRRGSEWAP